MPSSLVRSFNPIWSFVDLQGNQCDDSFYMYVLDNTIPYQPLTIWQDADANVAWSNPIQFYANGTLPDNMYWDDAQVYRLEIRQNTGFFPPSQSDPLIYLIQDYIPNGSGSSPDANVALFTDNQVTNPQFVKVNFTNNNYSLSATNPDPVVIGPGWELVLTGSGTLQMDRQPLNNTLATSSNAPYALHLVLTGWNSDGVYLRQRFNQNGMLWSNKYVSSTVTALIQGSPQQISAKLVDSNGSDLVSVLDAITVTSAFQEYRGVGLVPPTTNPDIPPDAYIEYRLAIPSNTSIYLTSFQLIASETQVQYPYEQDTVERQIDHVFHNYFDDILIRPKSSILTGWYFPLNPYQIPTPNVPPYITGKYTVDVNGYIADQTIIVQQNYVKNNIGFNVQRGIDANLNLTITPLTANNQFALIQYIDPGTTFGYWGYLMSALGRLRLNSTNGTTIRYKVRLFWNTNLPGVISRTDPIVSWDEGQDPVLAAGYNFLLAENDPIYSLPPTTTFIIQNDVFNKFLLPAAISGTQTLGIMVYTIDNMSTAGTADYTVVNQVGLVRNEFATQVGPETFNQVLEECQQYYETTYPKFSYPNFPPPGPNADSRNNLIAALNIGVSGGGPFVIDLYGEFLEVPWKTIKRTTSPIITTFSPVTGAAGNISVIGYSNNAISVGPTEVPLLSAYTLVSTGDKSAIYRNNTTSALASGGTAVSTNTYGYASYHATIDARLGV